MLIHTINVYSAVYLITINGPIIYPESLEEGKYTTGLYLGLDILIPKSYPNTTTTPTTPSQAISYNGQKAQSLKPTIAATNNPIYATNPINAVGAPSGYFLVEVSGVNASTNEMIGQNYSNPQIKGIVSIILLIHILQQVWNQISLLKI